RRVRVPDLGEPAGRGGGYTLDVMRVKIAELEQVAEHYGTVHAMPIAIRLDDAGDVCSGDAGLVEDLGEVARSGGRVPPRQRVRATESRSRAGDDAQPAGVRSGAERLQDAARVRG
ncbi:hypothetical protein IAE22_32820, partial [Bacillus sp. S34]|nr:hypothetical protein [Bacillus sp. S34]